ncbi:MAG: von Willebrand factor type A domain-containing protein [Gemmatimonadales bacterium]
MRAPWSFGLMAGLFLVSPSPNPLTRSGAAVEGTVSDAAGAPLAGATIAIEGTSFQAVSDRAGRYRIDRATAGNQTVTARLIGYEPSRRAVVLKDGQVVRVDHVLRAQSMKLEEIVTTGSTKPGEIATPGKESRGTQLKIRGVTGAAGAPSLNAARYRVAQDAFNTEEYKYLADNGWQSSARQPLSTFSIDVDAGSYSNVRRFLREGQLPPKDAVRVEEMINYFRYDYPDARDRAPFSITTELSNAPWRPGHKLALIGLQGQRLSMDELPPTNLVFLIDVSGSMQSADKLPLVKSAFRLLVNQLRDEDRVAIVVYAGAAGLVLPSTPGREKDRILGAIDGLEAGGSTAGGAGIQLAYKVARDHFIAEGNNRVILASDGDFNVGVSSEGELVRLIEERRKDGVFLTVLGFGTGNLKDAKMEQLANKGNGHYAYVDDLLEAKKVFVQELGATLLTIAKDVKIQVEFNPARVKSYRLVGYENRILADRDFNDDTKDAGEMGAGHAVTALYEIVPADGQDGDGAVDPLKYQNRRSRGSDSSGDWFTVKLRYKEPTGATSRLLERVVRQESRSPSADFRFASSVAQFGMLLRDSEFKGRSSFGGVLELARGARGRDEDGYRGEFIRLVETAAQLSGRGRDVTDPDDVR